MKTFLFLSFLFITSTSMASNLSETMELVQKRYQQIQSFEGRFEQEQYAPDQQLSKKASGQISFLRPGMMKWNYEAPHEQLIVTNGETLWLFDPFLNNVTQQPLNAIAAQTPLSFLLGIGKLQESFKAQPQTQKLISDSGLKILELVPQSELGNLAILQLGVDPKTHNLQVLVMQGTQGDYRVIRFSQIKYNLPLDPATFEFDVKPGMEVIGNEL